ncbi:MAG TPA: GNAT family N-acetyltransferase [Roseiflexaceae bacterium]|nr:GNAT family N-acetyltransferase [Roseiflexaceae bacterium]
MSEVERTVTLRAITKDNLRDIIRLQVAPNQQRFVAPNAVSLAEAHFEPELPWFRAIYADDIPVGFLMLEYDSAETSYNLWRFMIDERYQGLGYGRKALELLFAHVKTLPGKDVLYTHCVPAEDGPCPFYEKMGFVYTGEEEGGGVWMRRTL